MAQTPQDLVAGVAGVWLVLTGLAVGSFLNVVIARVPLGESVVKPRSKCPRCGHMLPWYENIPLFSWLILLGRCSSCKAPISFQYPLVELLTAALVWGCLMRFGWSWELLPALMLVVMLVPLSVIDAQTYLLPAELTTPGIVLGILTALPLGFERVKDACIGALAGFLLYWGLEKVGRMVFRQEALGAGDKYLVAMLGGFLTYWGLFGLVLLSNLQGAVVGLLLRAFTGRAGPSLPPNGPASEPRSERGPQEAAALAPEGQAEGEEEDWTPGPSNMPLGPWLALAGVEVLYFGPWMGKLLPGLSGLLAGP